MKNLLNQTEILKKSFYNKLESVEKKAWVDIFKSASPKTAGSLGLKYRSLSSAELTITASADVLALNRVLGFESENEITNELLTEIIKEFKNSGVPRFFLQVQPELLTEINLKKLNFFGFTHYNNWSKLYRNDSPVKEIKSDLIIDQIGKPGAKHFAEILIKSFEWDEKLYPWFFDFVQRDNWIHYLGYFKNDPVAAASLYIDGEFGWLGFAATLKT
ncbi:MAG TPA: hypothetical protein VMT35_08760, partial [Ignavibacteriaceae bacterium]|nr:hypothetical protein [Ignavibacteriaceae bacterium]